MCSRTTASKVSLRALAEVLVQTEGAITFAIAEVHAIRSVHAPAALVEIHVQVEGVNIFATRVALDTAGAFATIAVAEILIQVEGVRTFAMLSGCCNR